MSTIASTGTPPPIPTDRPLSLRGLAEAAGLHRWEVGTLVVEHRVRTHGLGPASVVVAEDMPRLAKLLARYWATKARRKRAARTGNSMSIRDASTTIETKTA